MASSINVRKIHDLLATKDDTSRFVGLVLLKTTLDKHASELQHDQVAALWDSISPRFLDRLIRTGSSDQKQSKEMLDVAVAVIYTFTKLLNDCAVSEKFYQRIPNLIIALDYSSNETKGRIVDLIYTLVQEPSDAAEGGAKRLAELDVAVWTPLLNAAPEHKDVFSIFYWAWTQGADSLPVETIRDKIDEALGLFHLKFKGHNSLPLLEFFTLLLDNLVPIRWSSDPRWLPPLTTLIKDTALGRNVETKDATLIKKRQEIYTQCAASLIMAFPEKAPNLLFCTDEPNLPRSSKYSSGYLFLSQVQSDILSTVHLWIPTLGTAEYPSMSRRIAADLDIMTSFVGVLISATDDDDDSIVSKGFTPDMIIAIHENLIRTVGDVMEYLRDRWDGHLAGARGIEPAQSKGTTTNIFEDPITVAAIRFLAIWLRDDDGETARSQAAGLIEFFAELYKINLASTNSSAEDVRMPILGALEGIIETDDGRNAFEEHGFWPDCLRPDLRRILASGEPSGANHIRGIAITNVLRTIIDANFHASNGKTRLDTLEIIARSPVLSTQWNPGVSDSENKLLLDFQTSLLELAVWLPSPEDPRTEYQGRLSLIMPVLRSAAPMVLKNCEAAKEKDSAALVRKLRGRMSQ
ncbi:DUF1941-domain-containing protein [Xylariaceae sp. FL0255]|nr:DUF1941-domain-containing protein [Xylariaceae sp. FL0255]